MTRTHLPYVFTCLISNTFKSKPQEPQDPLIPYSCHMKTEFEVMYESQGSLSYLQ